MSRIALIRHAESSHVQTGWIDAAGFRAWREAYEAAGIREDARPPKELERLASAADLVVSSNSARAVATAQLLAPGREITVSPLLRELDLEGPRLAGLRLPLRAWSFAVGGRILHRTIRREYPSADETSRIVDAAAWLDELAREHGFVVAVTHAMFRRSLASHLVECRWHAEPGPRSMAHWSAWIFASAASAVNTSD